MPEAPPRGYFEGESMTRRKVFIVGSQAVGGLAAAAVVLPAIGFALAPVFSRGRERWESYDEDPDVYIALSTRCAHLGCPVRFVQAARNFICPCHGGVYDFEGKRIGGPPVRPLDRFQTRVTGDHIELGPRYSVTNQLKAVRVRDPGEFTGGIWEYLYPPRPTTFPPPN